MIANMQQKYQQLTAPQKEIFAGYGLRQIKHFVEISLPTIEAQLPAQAQVQGINAQGKLQALDQHGHYYIWISDLAWQLAKQPSLHIDQKQDFLAVWQIFELADYPLIELSHVHRDFLQQLELSSH